MRSIHSGWTDAVNLDIYCPVVFGSSLQRVSTAGSPDSKQSVECRMACDPEAVLHASSLNDAPEHGKIKTSNMKSGKGLFPEITSKGPRAAPLCPAHANWVSEVGEKLIVHHF